MGPLLGMDPGVGALYPVSCSRGRSVVVSQLASLLEPQLEELVQRWTRRISEGLAPEGLPEFVLRDHIVDVLRELVRTLHQGIVPAEVVSSEKHGKQRFQAGFDIDALVREYGVLRGIILELAEEAGLGLSMREVRVLTDFIASAIADGVAEYDLHRSRAEEALTRGVRKQEAQLRAVLESTAEGIWGVDQGGVCTFANPAAARMLGAADATEMVGHDMLGEPYSRPGPGSERSLASVLGEVLRTGQETRGTDVWMERLDGTTFPVRYSISPSLRDDHGLGAVVTFEDITERRQNEQILASARLMSDSALTAGSVGIFTWDIGSNRVFGDRSFSELFGIALDASGSAPIADYLAAIHPDDRSATTASIEHTVADGGPYEAEYRIVSRGHERWVVARGRVERDEQGQPVRFLGVVMDITDRKQAEAAARAAQAEAEADRHRLLVSEEARRRVLESSGAGLWELDVATGAIAADARMLELMGLPPGCSLDLATTLDRLVAVEDREKVQTALAAAMAGENEGHYLAEFRTGGRDGAPLRWVESRARVTFDAAGKARSLGGAMIDITERKRSESERERLVEELTRSNTALDQFAHVASHDLRAPLRGIGNLATWIEDDLGDALTDDVRDKLGLMRGRVRHLETMITGILDFATAGRNQTETEPVDIARLVGDVIGLLAPPEQTVIAVVEPMPSLTTERVALQQVVMNLLGNAIKHAQGDHATIRLEARDEGDFVHLTVRDNGPGIDPKDHERIWGLFQKGPSRTKVEGSGIGLAVVKKTVESRGGRVWVESSPGQGATFHVLWARLPATEILSRRRPS